MYSNVLRYGRGHLQAAAWRGRLRPSVLRCPPARAGPHASARAARTYYDVLGVDTTASADDIKTAFRKQAKALHPDVNKSEDSEEEFMRVKEAYDTLMDDRTRAQYDEMLRQRQRQQSSRAAGSSGRGGAGEASGRRVVVWDEDMGIAVEVDLEDIAFEFFAEDSDDDSDDDEDDGFMEEFGYEMWAASPNNVRSSFQSSWQANSRKKRRRGKQDQVLTLSDKEVLLQELPRQQRVAAQQMFGARLQKLSTLEELAELIEAVDELEMMGISFEDTSEGGSTAGTRGRGTGTGGSGRSGRAGAGRSSNSSSGSGGAGAKAPPRRRSGPGSGTGSGSGTGDEPGGAGARAAARRRRYGG